MNPKENLLRALAPEKPEWVPAPAVDGSMAVVTHGLTEYAPGGGFDSWGVEWRQGEEESGAGVPVTHPIRNPEEVKSHPFPDPEEPGLMEPAREALSEIDRRETLVLGDNGWGLFERAWILVGMDRFLIWTYREPEAVEQLLDRIAAVKVRITERLIEEAGVDGIRYGDDWGGENELMMGPDLWRKFIKPRQRSLYDSCKEEELLVMQHADGHVEEIIPDLIEMGLDLLNPLQPECNDVEEVVRKYGDSLAFHGVVSSRLLDNGSPAEVKEEVRTRINQLSAGGGYVVAPAHAHSYPEENVEAFREAAAKFGDIPDRWIREPRHLEGDIEL